jgi:basic amino acid/polyamine antiporter, APA family
MEKSNLVRAISRWDLMAITINTIIGAGIFGLPSKVAALIGNYSIFAFVVCALIIAVIVICFAEVASRFKDTGGMYLYAKEAFGSVVGFEVGWLYWVVRITTFAANCNLFITYLSYFFPDAKVGSTRTAIIVGIVAVLTAVNFLGVKQSVILTNIFTVGKLVPLIIFASVGLFFIQPTTFTFPPIAETGSFSDAILLLIYAFVGFEAAAIPAGETKDPQKSVPFALLSALAISAVLFILIQIVCIGTLPELAKSERPLADAANNFLGVFGAAFITVGALISIMGNLNVGFMTGSRMPFAMAENRELPSVFAVTHNKFKTPYISLFATSIAGLIYTLSTDFVAALTISTIVRLIVYATTCASLPVFRFRENSPKAAFVVPFGIVAAILSLGLIAWLLSNVNYKTEGFAVLVVVEIGLFLGLLNEIFRRKAR